MAKKKEKKQIKVEEVFEPNFIMLDRNKLAARSQEIGRMIALNNIKDPDMKDPKIIIENVALQGANNMIIEILDNYDKDNTPKKKVKKKTKESEEITNNKKLKSKK